jgi:hypothetical protein
MNLQIKIEDLRKYSLFIGVPMYGAACTGAFCKSAVDLAKACTQYGIKTEFYYLFNESLIQRARNYIVDTFLQSEFTHLMFIDADIAFAPNDVLTLLGIQISDPDKYGLIAAPYPKKVIAWEKVETAVKKKLTKKPTDLNQFTADYAFNLVKGTQSFMLTEPAEVLETGTGFMLISRDILNQYEKEYPQFRYKPDHIRSDKFDGSREIMAFFDCKIDPETKRYLSEDYFFCQNLRKIGIPINICPWINLVHIGTYMYRGNMNALAQLHVTPTSTKKRI